MTFTNCLLVPLDQTKPHREAQSVVFIVSVRRACPVRINLKRCVYEMTLLEFDPISVERLIQPHRDHLRQLPDEKLVFRNEATCSMNVFVFEDGLHWTFPLYETIGMPTRRVYCRGDQKKYR
jgi:hypothetical protein